MLAALANPILPVFFVMAIGLACGKVRLFDHDMARALNAFVFYVGQPALIFLLAAKAPFSAYDPVALGAYFASEVLLYGGVAAIAYFLFRRGLAEALLLGMTTVFVNHLFYVLPIVRMLHGDAAGAPVEGAIFVDVAVLFCGTVFLMDLVARPTVSIRETPLLLAKNPILWALAAGVGANLTGFDTLPDGLETFARFAGNAAPPISLFALGVVLSNVRIFNPEPMLAVILCAKNLVHPILLLGLFALAGPSPDWSKSLTLLAAGPCGAMPFVIALQYGVATQTMARAILLSTLISLFSLAALNGLVM